MSTRFRRIPLLLLLAAASCKAFDPKLLNPTATTVNPKLPAMESSTSSEVTVVVAPGQAAVASGSRDLQTLFEREVRETLTNPYGDKKGQLDLKVTTTRTRLGFGWIIPGSILLGVPYLFGMPMATPSVQVSTQLDVLDNQRRLLATYRADGEARAVSSFYSSTNYAEPGRVIYIQAVRQCLDQIKTKMQPDLERLRGQLQ